MYILDEPSIGLHPRDTERLIGVLKRLRDIGNTVIVVEHDEEIIRAADLLIDMGPLAGVHGGELVYAGKAADAKPADIDRSLTLQYLNGQKLRYVREKSTDELARFTLTVPSSLLEPGKPATLGVTAEAKDSRRWFAVMEP